MAHPQATTFTGNVVKSIRVNGADMPVANLTFFDRTSFVPAKIVQGRLESASKARASWSVNGGVLALESSTEALNKSLGVTGDPSALVAFVRAWEIVDAAGMVQRSFDKVNDLENILRDTSDARRALATLATLEARKRQGRASAKDTGLLRSLWGQKAQNEALVEQEPKLRKSLAFAEKCLAADRQNLQNAKEGNGYLTTRIRKGLNA